MTLQRWRLKNAARSLDWTMPINPNSMSSPHYQRGTIGYSVSPVDAHVRAFRPSLKAFEWQFGGVIRTQEHHDTLRDWCGYTERITLTDHLDRTWRVRLFSFEPEERRPTPSVPWRFRYVVRAYMYGRVS